MLLNRISGALLVCMCSSLCLYSQQIPSPCAVSGTDQSEIPDFPDVISGAGTDTFDVVFHVVHLGQPIGSGSNISDEQIKSSLFSLNRDFGAWPIHDSIAIAPNGTNSEVFFRLACTAPDGSPTTGINRVDASSFPDYATKGFNFKTDNTGNYKQLADLSHWPQNRYLNIWITHRLETFTGVTSGGGGFNAATPIFQQGYGGVYMVFRYVGCDVDGSQGFVLFNKYGKLITHEVGHYLGLLHTFEGESCTETDCATQGDRVCDTEPHSNSVPNDPSCGEFVECNTREPVENIMNYSGLYCKNIITPGQKNRMKWFISQYYQNMINLPGCAVSSATEATYKDLVSFPNPVTDVLFLPYSPEEAVQSVSIYNVSGDLCLSQDISDTTQPGQIRVVGLPAGLYVMVAFDRSGRLLYRSRFVRQ